MPFESYKCWRCGKKIQYKHEPKMIVYCEECAKMQSEEHNRLIKDYAILKIKVMHRNALRIMEKSGKCYMHEYEESSKRILQKALENTENYMSAHEMIVGIVLNNYCFDYKPNFKILNYRVDFYIPEIKVCLEVDGAQHVKNLMYDGRRDIEIRNVLGSDWEVVRIKTKYIEENPEKIIEALELLAKEKRRLRKKNNGIIPYGFSKRENVLYEEVTN